jgi:hypothetical protein
MASKKVKPQPVTIVPTAKPGNAVTRLGTPTAFLMLTGLFLVYYALRGFDQKYGTFGGTFAGVGYVPTGTKPRYATPTAPTKDTGGAA